MTTEKKRQLREEILEKFTRQLDERLDPEVHAVPGELVDFMVEKIEEAESAAVKDALWEYYDSCMGERDGHVSEELLDEVLERNGYIT